MTYIDIRAAIESRFKLIKVVLFRFLAEILKRSFILFLTIALSFRHKVKLDLPLRPSWEACHKKSARDLANN